MDAVEIYHYYAGAPLELSVVAEGKEVKAVTLGSDLAAGQRPLGIVQPHTWQSAKFLGDWTLVGCAVAPGGSSEPDLADRTCPSGHNPVG